LYEYTKLRVTNPDRYQWKRTTTSEFE